MNITNDKGLSVEFLYSVAEVVDLASTDFTPSKTVKGIYVGVSGDVKVNLLDKSGTATAFTFKAAPVGILPISPTLVVKTGTTATNMLVLY